jgi:heavy metal efflux system protein
MGCSLTAQRRVTKPKPSGRMRKIIMSFPEVETVVSQHGRPQDGTGVIGFFNAEFFVR